MTRPQLIFILTMAVLCNACKSDKVSVDNVLNIRLKKDPERINPLLFPNPTAREVYQYLHLPLADYDPESLELTPLLITSIPSEIAIDTGKYKGGVAFDIEFAKDAKWDDGSPITADDYIFTIKSINLPLTNAGKYREITQNISDIITDPAHKNKCRVIFDKDYILALETAVNIELYPKYFYDSLHLLDKYTLRDFRAENEAVIKNDSILIKFAERYNSNDFSRNKISGAGPYKFAGWVSDQYIRLEKKSNYWAGNKPQMALKQGPDKIIFHIIPDELTAITQLKAGNIDLVNEISGDAYKELSNDSVSKGKFSFYHPALVKQYFININNKDPKLSDKNVRRALAHMIDVDNIIQNIENGMGVKTTGPIHPIKKTINKSLLPVTYDIDKAKQLLAGAGWKDTNNDGVLDKKTDGKKIELELEILISGQETGKKIALMLQESGAKAGVKIIIKEKDFKLIRNENLKTRKYHLIPAVLSQDLIAWDDLSKWHSRNDTPDGSNDMSYHNPSTDALIDKIISTKSDEDRIALYQKIQELIYTDQPAIFMYAPEEKIVVSKKWNSSSTVKRPGYMANTFSLAAKVVPSVN